MQYAIPKYVILLGGECVAHPYLVDYCKNAFVIAADSGIAHAEKIQTKVDLWIGDFDSASPTLLSQYHHVPRQTFPVEKDKTDGELAINYAIAQGAQHILCVGALGGARSDHTLQHFMHALALKQQGVHLTLTDGRQLARALLAGETYVALEPNSPFSLIPFSRLEGVHIEGARWSLSDQTVERGSSLTLSNIANGTVRIFFNRGEALFITGSFKCL